MKGLLQVMHDWTAESGTHMGFFFFVAAYGVGGGVVWWEVVWG